MADLGDLFTGTPPTYGVQMMGGGKSPLFDFAKYFGQYMKGLVGQPLPSYPGQIDPGMSPTMSGLGQMLQAFSRSPLPNVMGQAGGVLGRFMNPSFANPMARMQMMGGNAPQFFGGGMRNPFQGSGGQNPYSTGPSGPMPLPPWLSGGGMGVTPGQSPPWASVPPWLNTGTSVGPGGGMDTQPTPPWMQPPGGGPPVSPVGGGMDVSPMGGGPAPGPGVGMAPPPMPMVPFSPGAGPTVQKPLAPPTGPLTDIGIARPMPGGPSVSPVGGGPSVSPMPPNNPSGTMSNIFNMNGGVRPPAPPPSGLRNAYMPKKGQPRKRRILR